MILQISLIGEVEQSRVIAEADKVGRLHPRLGHIIDFKPPPLVRRRLKIYYMTQAGVKPPHFICFCNDARLFHFSYQRYLENQIRTVFGLEGTPIKMTIRQKGDKED